MVHEFSEIPENETVTLGWRLTWQTALASEEMQKTENTVIKNVTVVLTEQ